MSIHAAKIRFLRALGAGLLYTCLPGCLSIQWQGVSVGEPIDVAGAEQVQVGQSRLDAVMAALGAPSLVRRAAGGGMWLIWSWAQSSGWALSVSVPLRVANASVSWNDNAEHFVGLAALFDQDLVLRELRRGRLPALLRGAIDPRRARHRSSASIFE